MKKIKSSTVSQKDRVVCVTVTGAHKFYYQPCKSKGCLYLFTTEDFSGSVFAYFRDNGRCMDDVVSALPLRNCTKTARSTATPRLGRSLTACWNDHLCRP
jgi:hypothetical protein